MKTPTKTHSLFYSQAKAQLYPSIAELEAKKQMKKSHSSFFEQSYIDKLKKRKERSNSFYNNMINQDNLNSLLCKLKNYFNEVLCITQKKQHELDLFKEDGSFLSFQLRQIIDFQDIELPDEKISVKNFNTLKVSKDQLETKIRSFVKEKSELEDVFKNEIEYAKTIEYMHQQEKDNLKAINDEIHLTEEKIQAINVFRRNIDANILVKQKKQKNYSQIVAKLNDDMDLIETVIEDQTKKSTGLDKTILHKEQECSVLKSQIRATQKMNNEVVQKEKEEVQSKLFYTNELIRQKCIKEQSYIKTILCLNFIQKYFLSGNEGSSISLTESKEYKEFLNDKIYVYDENFNVVFEPNSEDTPDAIKLTSYSKKKSNPDRSFQNSSLNNSINQPANSRSNTPSHLKSFTIKRTLQHRSSSSSVGKESRLTLAQLKQKFDEIEITRKELFQFYYRIIDRIRFYRNDLIKLNDKQILYENRKDVYYKKVKEIILKDYKNFADLIRNNSRFQAFIGRNEKLIDDSRNKHELSKQIKINKGFHETNNFFFKETEGNKSFETVKSVSAPFRMTPNSIEVSSIDLYQTAGQLLREAKNFFEGVYLIIRRSSANFGDKSNEQYKKIERVKAQLSSYKQEPFECYLLKLIEFITSEERLERLVNGICGENSLAQLKEDIFIEGDPDKPNEDYINQLLSKNLHNQNELFAFLKEKRKLAKAFKAAFSYKLNSKSIDETSLIHPVSPKKEMKELGKTIYHNKLKTAGKGNLIRNQRETISNHDDSYSDKDTALSENKTAKKKNNSVDHKIIQKLYEPVLVKTLYNRRLNNNMSVIKGITRSNSKANYALLKKRQEVDEMSNSLLIYNNKKINVNELSNSSYNTMVRYVVSNQAAKIWKTKDYQ